MNILRKNFNENRNNANTIILSILCQIIYSVFIKYATVKTTIVNKFFLDTGCHVVQMLCKRENVLYTVS